MSTSTALTEGTTLTIGQVLGHSKQFRIVRLLGRGGMGEVYLAHEARAERYVAIKVMRPEHNQKPKLLRRFKGEYTLGGRIIHPNLVQMYDLAETPEGVHYIVMEYVEGVMLGQKMFQAEQTNGELGLQALMNIGWQIGNLFAQLHERKLIHRDLKPANIMVTKEPGVHGGERYKLLDFGIAKLDDLERAKALNVEFDTTTGSLMGTVMYMGPESLRVGGRQGPEGDVYALGCILYRCIAGLNPFVGKSEEEIINQHLTQMPIPLTADDPSTPEDVAGLVHRMLEKDPAKRPTMAEIGTFFALRLGLADGAAGQIVVRGGTRELQAVIGEMATGSPGSTAGGAISMVAELSGGDTGNTGAKNGQQVSLPPTVLGRPSTLRAGILAGVFAIVGAALGTLAFEHSRRGKTLPPVPTAPAPAAAAAAAAPPIVPDMAKPAEVATSVEPTDKPAKPAATERKRHHSRKKRLMVND